MSFPYKLGKLEAVWPQGLKEITSYSVGTLPTPPDTLAVPGFNSWGMLMNDTLGCCGVAGLQHGFEATATVTHEVEHWPSDQQCGKYYLTYTGGQDAGVVLADFLKYVHQRGYYRHSVKLYAPADKGNVTTLKTVVYLYDFAYCGIQVPQSAMDQAQAGQPWTVSGNNTIIGGHCIPIVGYDSNYLYCITWGQVQPMTYDFWTTYGDEAWAVITGEIAARHGDGRGINIKLLEADLSKLNEE